MKIQNSPALCFCRPHKPTLWRGVHAKKGETLFCHTYTVRYFLVWAAVFFFSSFPFSFFSFLFLHNLCIYLLLLFLLLLLLLLLYLLFFLLLLLQSEENSDCIILIWQGSITTTYNELLLKRPVLVSSMSSFWWHSMTPSPPSVHWMSIAHVYIPLFICSQCPFPTQHTLLPHSFNRVNT